MKRLNLISSKMASSTSNSKIERETVGFVVIGDEILKGQTRDSNSNYLAQSLYKMGLSLKKISVIPDDLDVIVKEVKLFSEKYNYVLTSGGIGPTHDDITYEAIAKTFNQEMFYHPDIVQQCARVYKGDPATELHSPKFKMALIPKNSKLLYHAKSKYPTINCGNVYIFPGVPQLFTRNLDQLGEIIFSARRNFHFRQLYLSVKEVVVADWLNQVVERFRESVIIGSYPKWNNPFFETMLTFQADDEESVEGAYQMMLGFLENKSAIVEYESKPENVASEKVFALANEKSSLGESVRKSIEIINDCIGGAESSDEIAVAFNGGKDCTALLHIYHAVLQKRFGSEKRPTINALYIRSKSPFPETEEFIKNCVDRYDINLITYNGDMKEALHSMKREYPNIKSILLGQRHRDPNSKHISSKCQTDVDKGWPDYIRYHPILHWGYGEVWHFLRSLFIPYCSLYDHGYTSLGWMEDSRPNAKLLVLDEHLGKSVYRPAYELEDSEDERSNR